MHLDSLNPVSLSCRDYPLYNVLILFVSSSKQGVRSKWLNVHKTNVKNKYKKYNVVKILEHEDTTKTKIK